jgi:nucleoside phosphorylase
MPLVYIFAASKMEARPLVRRVTRNHGANQVVLTITGMGPANAKSKAEAAFKSIEASAHHAPPIAKPDTVLVIGVCGALTNDVREQCVVIYNECLSTDPARQTALQCSPVLCSTIAENLQSHGIPCNPVIGITSCRMATTRAEKAALARAGASVVDMESYEILAAAGRAGARAAILRVVSDSLGVSMPDFNRALDGEGRLRQLKALRIAVGSPLKTLRLLASYRRAVERLSVAVILALESSGFAV